MKMQIECSKCGKVSKNFFCIEGYGLSFLCGKCADLVEDSDETDTELSELIALIKGEK